MIKHQQVKQAAKNVIRFPNTLRWIAASNGYPLTANEARLKALHNSCMGARAFIIGNGPSLKDVNFDKLKDEVTIASNSAFRLKDTIGFTPTYYTVKDKLAAAQYKKDIIKLTGSVKLAPWVLGRYLPNSRNLIHFNFEGRHPDCPQPFSKSFLRRVACGYTVSYTNLQLAFYLGVSTAILIGFDHNYAVPDGLQSGAIIRSDSADKNHFEPLSFQRGVRWYAPNLDRMTRSLYIAREAFEGDGRTIYNATSGGNLDVFPRVDLGKIVG